jgi:hypothetical protein
LSSGELISKPYIFDHPGILTPPFNAIGLESAVGRINFVSFMAE